MSDTNIKYFHVNMTLTVNENTWSWGDPKATTNINFEMPLDLFDAGKLAKLVEGRIKELLNEYPDRVDEHALKVAQEEAEKAKLEGEG